MLNGVHLKNSGSQDSVRVLVNASSPFQAEEDHNTSLRSYFSNCVDNYSLNSEKWSLDVLAGGLKLFFRELKEPLFTFELFPKLKKLFGKPFYYCPLTLPSFCVHFASLMHFSIISCFALLTERQMFFSCT